MPADPRLIIISNRLPVTIKLVNGSYECSQSTGGLAGALSGLGKSMPFRWFGWPGLEIPQEDEELVSQKVAEHNVLPIFLDNSTLWPLFHYQLHEMGRIDKAAWEAYYEVNLLFAKVITSQLHDGDTIWIHDYHLMLLPQFLREITQQSGLKVKIGFFLHTPFPSSEVYRILPMRKKILTGVLHCDLIGFHTASYARHFLSSCSEVLVAVGAFPIGIQPERFADAVHGNDVQERIRMLLQRYQGAKLIVSVDRLDYIKGLPQKLHALEVFLARYPEWVGKVVLMQVAVPTRQDVEEYQSLRAEVNELVGRINGKYVSFLYRALDFEEIVALYAVSDVCLVSSTRDGMNLVSLEYTASQRLKHGSLVLSEFTGAAEVLDGSIVFNPWDVEESVDALRTALTMEEKERAANFHKLEEHVIRNTRKMADD
ncbi:trehalose-6-P synthase/phosphatase complex synthase subunit [Penicillium waksmanii]|uniref:trehalose-6-P synthase/phosphatase complex synthase subunit n=1 Tax=Penicillium waksmanii TaxID=69791 RepID=UPI0025471550|nr:trehalose-6-P synthase/phosphatase complex synthase subunit [Penicillium waksmanii]KAJ6000999.1 trehalose-6-P synthase/phosphatase complex synthase subunit [Penicillium waksmanii]